MHQRAKECTNHDPHSLLRQWSWAVVSAWPEGLYTDFSSFPVISGFFFFFLACSFGKGLDLEVKCFL